jgi:hypothetical protein
MEKHIVTKEEVWAGFDRLEKIMAKDREQRAKDHAEAKERSKALDAQMAKDHAEAKERSKALDAQMAKTDIQIAEVSAFVKATCKETGGIGNSNGDFAEDYFAGALKETKIFAGVQFDHFTEDIKGHDGDIDDQYDGVFYNGDSIGIVEVKYKAKTKDLEDLRTNKLAHFRLFFPKYANYKFYLGLASLSFDKKVVKRAYDLGICLLKQKGKAVEMDLGYIKPY